MTGSVQHYRCRRCDETYSTNEPLPSCSRGPCPMEPVDGLFDGPCGKIEFKPSAEMLANAAKMVGVTYKAIEFNPEPPLPDGWKAALQIRGTSAWSVMVRDDGTVELGEGVTLDEASKAFWSGVERYGVLPAPARAAHALSRAEMIAVYDAMKSEDILANVEPGDHGNAILEAYGRRVIAAAIEKAQAGGKA